MMTNLEKGKLVSLFNRDGYVLDFSTSKFDAFTMGSVGVALCQKYGLSKGASLNRYVNEATPEDSWKLLSDLLNYYENQYQNFEKETNDSDLFGSSTGSYKKLYLTCKEIVEKYKTIEPNKEMVKSIEETFSTDYMSQQIKLMIDNQETYPAESIGKAKELVESCCRTILAKRGEVVDKKWTFQQLVNQVFKVLDVLPNAVDEKNPIAGNLKQLYGSLKGMVNPMAEIRNAFGTGHGKTFDFDGLDSRHAKLLVGMSITMVQFLWSTHESKTTIKCNPLFD